MRRGRAGLKKPRVRSHSALYEGLDWSQGRPALPTPVNSQIGRGLLDKELLPQQNPNSLSQSCMSREGCFASLGLRLATSKTER